MPTPKRQLLSRTVYDTDGSTTVWDFSFTGGYIDVAHVKAFVLDAAKVRTDLIVTPNQIIGQYQILITPALAAGQELFIYRDTPKNLPIVDFEDAGGLSEIALDTNAKQAVFIAAEVSDSVGETDIAALTTAATAAVAAAVTATSAAASAQASLGTILGETSVVKRSGNSVATVFAIGTLPSEARADVFIGGVYQNRGTYSIASGNITFTEAPPTGTDNIEIISNIALPLGAIVGPPGLQGPPGPPGPAGTNGTGDMNKSVYDPNNDGKVTSAVNADVAPWAGITDKPAAFTPATHTHVVGDISGLSAPEWALLTTLSYGSGLNQLVAILSSLAGWGTYTDYRLELDANLNGSTNVTATAGSSSSTISSGWVGAGYRVDSSGINPVGVNGLNQLNLAASNSVGKYRATITLLSATASNRVNLVITSMALNDSQTTYTAGVNISLSGIDRIIINTSQATAGTSTIKVYAK